MRVGFIGLGTMGEPMAAHLLHAGHQLAVHDVRPGTARELLVNGAAWGDTPRAVASRSEVVFTSLPGPREVEEVLLNPDSGILAGLASGDAFIDTSTNFPTTFRKLAEECRTRGVEVLDAPVSGAQRGANEASLAIMVGGEESTFFKYRPLLESLGRHIYHMGSSGAGMTAKLIVQHLVHANIAAAAEGFILGQKAGLDIETLQHVLAASGSGSRAVDMFPNLVFSGRFAGRATFDMTVKDLSLVRQLASELQMSLPVFDVVNAMMERGQASGCESAGFLIAARAMEVMNGTELRSKEALTDSG